MVYLVAGYAMKPEDARAWAQRHWPNIVFNNDKRLETALGIMRHNRKLGGNMECILAKVDDAIQCLFVVHQKQDWGATPTKFKPFRESPIAVKFKTLLFPSEKHGDLAERMKWTTVADPFCDWPLVSFRFCRTRDTRIDSSR